MSIFKYRSIFLLNYVKKPININFINFTCNHSTKYTPKEYGTNPDPRPQFISKDVQQILRKLTRIDLSKVYRKKRLGNKKLEEPTYKFLTDRELEEAMKEINEKVNILLQMPPVVPVLHEQTRILSKDPALQGLETSRFVFTDITFGVRDSERLIVIRDTDGTLHDAEVEIRNRVNQLYFPKPNRKLKTPKMFEDSYLEDLLNRHEYEFVLDCACAQFEPEDAQYQRVVSVTYQHLNDYNAFDDLRSTRHFGNLIFFLVWHKCIDNLLLELIETSQLEEAKHLIILYNTIHKISSKTISDIELIEEFTKTHSKKRAPLELALQAFIDIAKQKEELIKGIQTAHGEN